jgi:hypothetical protein
VCVLCVWSSVEEESAGGVCVFYDVKPLCEREKRVFFFFFFSQKKRQKAQKLMQMADRGEKEEVILERRGDERARA